MLQNKVQVETVNFQLYFKVISCILKMTFFRICFLFYFFKLSAGHGFKSNIIKLQCIRAHYSLIDLDRDCGFKDR